MFCLKSDLEYGGREKRKLFVLFFFYLCNIYFGCPTQKKEDMPGPISQIFTAKQYQSMPIITVCPGNTDYLDLVHVNDLQGSKWAKGIDCFRRPFVVLHFEIVTAGGKILRCIQTLFQVLKQ